MSGVPDKPVPVLTTDQDGEYGKLLITALCELVLNCAAASVLVLLLLLRAVEATAVEVATAKEKEGEEAGVGTPSGGARTAIKLAWKAPSPIDELLSGDGALALAAELVTLLRGDGALAANEAAEPGGGAAAAMVDDSHPT